MSLPREPKEIAAEFFNEAMEMIGRGARTLYDNGVHVEQIQDELRTSIIAIQNFIEYLDHNV